MGFWLVGFCSGCVSEGKVEERFGARRQGVPRSEATRAAEPSPAGERQNAGALRVGLSGLWLSPVWF
jgi:hypothetical protein